MAAQQPPVDLRAMLGTFAAFFSTLLCSYLCLVVNSRLDSGASACTSPDALRGSSMTRLDLPTLDRLSLMNATEVLEMSMRQGMICR